MPLLFCFVLFSLFFAGLIDRDPEKKDPSIAFFLGDSLCQPSSCIGGVVVCPMHEKKQEQISAKSHLIQKG